MSDHKDHLHQAVSDISDELNDHGLRDAAEEIVAIYHRLVDARAKRNPKVQYEVNTSTPPAPPSTAPVGQTSNNAPEVK